MGFPIATFDYFSGVGGRVVCNSDVFSRYSPSSKFGVAATICFFRTIDPNGEFSTFGSGITVMQRSCEVTEVAVGIEESQNSKVQLDCRRFSRNEASRRKHVSFKPGMTWTWYDMVDD
jgi:hypothetical protein